MEVFERLAAQKVVFVAAFTEQSGRVPSNIPFAIAADGPRAGSAFGTTQGFSIAIIGLDGNIDYITSRVLPGQRVFPTGVGMDRKLEPSMPVWVLPGFRLNCWRADGMLFV
jgi:hypothetical protein